MAQPVTWAVFPGPIADTNPNDGSWTGELPDQNNYTIIATDANNAVHTFGCGIANLPTLIVTQDLVECGMLGATLCLDDEDYAYALWTEPLGQYPGLCANAFYTGDYSYQFDYHFNNEIVPAECTTFIETFISISSAFGNPFNVNFDCDNGGYTGSITVTPTGGSGVYQYNWLAGGSGNGATTAFTTTNPIETFQVTITDLVNNITCNASVSVDLGFWACVYDLNDDGVVSTLDTIIFMGEFGFCTGNITADFDCDGCVDVNDLLDFIAAYGEICP
ncbi:MAG: SprB repeat-containing protein [Flavobacteriales bacterium]